MDKEVSKLINTYYKKAELYYTNKQYDEAIIMLDRIKDLDVKTSKVIELRTKLADIYFDNAKYYIKDNKAGESLYNIKKALDVCIDEIKIKSLKHNIIDLYYKNAEKAYSEGDYEQTEQYLKNIEELENNNLPAKILSAKTLYHQGFYDEALNSLNNILNNNQNTDSKLLSDIQEFFGYIHYLNTNYADAIKEFSNAINNNPNTNNLGEIYEYRGICYYETNEPIEALFDIAKAIDLTKGKTVNELGEYIRKINEENPNTQEIQNCIENFDGKYLYYCIETDNIAQFIRLLETYITLGGYFVKNSFRL